MSSGSIDKRVFSHGPVVIFRWAIEEGWPVEFVTENVAEILGVSADDFVSGRVIYADMIHPDDLKRVEAEVEKILKNGPDKYQHDDYRAVKPNGEVVWLQDFTVLERNETGEVVYATGYIVDITERRAIEAELRAVQEQLEHRVEERTKELTREITERQAAQDRLRGAVESLQEGFALFDADDRLVEFNDAYHQLNPAAKDALEKGMTFEDLLRANIQRGVLAEARGREEEFVRERMVAHRNPGKAILRNFGDGRCRLLKETRTPEGGIALTFVDITDMQRAIAAQKKIQAEAEEARALLHDAIESTTDGFAIFDADERLIVFNKTWAHLNRESLDLIENGVMYEELLRSRAAKGLIPDIGDDPEEWIRRRVDQFRNPKGPIERVFPDGSWWQINDQRTSTGGVAQVATNITQLKKREAELRESEERFRTTFEDTAVGTAIVGPDFKYRLANDAFLGMFGYPMEELRELTPMDITHPDDRPQDVKNLSAFNTGETDAVHLEKRYIRKDGSELWAIVSASVVRDPDGQTLYSIRHVQDITERKRGEEAMKKLQGELTHVSRVSTMGEMAAGFAHELNQPLAAISNYAQGTLRRYRSGAIEMDDFARVLELVVEQAHRAGDIIRKIRQFVRKDEPERGAINVNAAIREATDLVRSEVLQYDATIDLDLDEHLPPINADAVQLQQVVLNLARNGLEAMRDNGDDDRVLTIRTMFREATGIEIVVEDLGPGIPMQIRNQLFDPFFTTKNDGMGMGLSICQSIIEAHGGQLKADEGKTDGAAFCIVLPVSQ